MAFGERLISSNKNFLNSKKQTPNLATPPPRAALDNEFSQYSQTYLKGFSYDACKICMRWMYWNSIVTAIILCCFVILFYSKAPRSKPKCHMHYITVKFHLWEQYNKYSHQTVKEEWAHQEITTLWFKRVNCDSGGIHMHKRSIEELSPVQV